MQLDQTVRRFTHGIVRFFRGIFGFFFGWMFRGRGTAVTTGAGAAPSAKPAGSGASGLANRIASILTWVFRRLSWRSDRRGIRLTVRVALVLAVLGFFYFFIGSIWLSKVDSNLTFAPPHTAGESRSVAMAAALIDREIGTNGWTPNDPPLWPTYILDNMPNFQRGMLQALGRFSIELTDQLGRIRGSSQADPDLELASGNLRYPPDRWHWNPSESLFAITITSEKSYGDAAEAMKRYNQRLAAGDAIFERRADNLMATLDRMALDLGSASATIDEFVEDQAGFPWNWKVDDLFYRTKGQLYGYYMILRELQVDFDLVLEEKKLKTNYAEMLRSLEQAIQVQPMVVLNASTDAQIFPNHLSQQGFYLLRARTQLRELTAVLRA